MIIQFPTYTILKQEPTRGESGTRSGRIVLVEKHDEEHHPFVTAWLGDGDHQWTSGHYFETLDIATIDYYERCLFDARRAISRGDQRKMFKETTEIMQWRANQTEEEKQRRKENHRQGLANMTEEQKEQYSKRKAVSAASGDMTRTSTPNINHPPRENYSPKKWGLFFT